MTAAPAELPPDLPGLDPAWSRLVSAVDADGTKRCWHVLDRGPAEPRLTLLCVHGNPTWSYLWRRLIAKAPDDVRVVAPDQLGMGWSERPAAARTLAQRVEDLSGLTDALEITGPVVTVGHDWGGAISLGWAQRHRSQLRGVVLTNTAVHLPAGSAAPPLIRLARLPGVRQVVCVRTPIFVRAATALSRPALPAETRDAYASPYSSAARRRAVGDFVGDIPLSPGHHTRSAVDDVAEGTRRLDVPALLLWGPRDPVFGERFLRDLQDRLPHAQLHRYAGASHLLPEDAPGYADAVVRWLAGLDAPAGPAAAAVHAVHAAPRPALWARLDERADDEAAAVVEVGRRRVSWRMLAARVEEIARGLAAAGVRPGQRVALLVPPSADLTAAVYAVWRAGAVVVVADQGLGLRGMGRALRGARLDAVIGTAQGLAAARAMRLPGLRFAAGAPAPALARALGAEAHLADLARRGRAAAGHLPTPSPDDECAVVFTSGATGPAKGVRYRHRQVQAQLDLLRSTYELRDDDRIVAAFAPFAIYGPALGIGSAVPDMDVTAPGTLTATALADAVAAVDATVVFASPAALRSLLATAHALSTVQRTALGRVRLLMSAGAPVPVPLLRSLREVMPAAEAHTPYGMTEVLPVTDISLEQVEAAGDGEGVCVGWPLPEVEVAVSPLSPAGAADGPLTTDPHRTGEVCVQAEHVMDGYDALWVTQQASARDPGWHRTGDVGHLDEAGRLWIEGRLQHVLVTAGAVLTPVGTERRVEVLPQVQAAAVVGVGPAGTAQVVVVVVPAGDPVRRWSSPVAPPDLAVAVRAAAGVDVAAVLRRRALPVDVRHASKVDRTALAGWAAGVLAGSGG